MHTVFGGQQKLGGASGSSQGEKPSAEHDPLSRRRTSNAPGSVNGIENASASNDKKVAKRRAGCRRSDILR
ncbi:hypothetical protein EMCG_01583 [[Emmonsia] crescens]|uniref:Uncharacterized protein n=1 Tax=[Emmonsia] crescens TaxID=73230 RepID=A0A0G2I0G9_9EURO|nr:hypothetical protein EMCG_01583 [Emmonsia crescens UAMH 3008]